MGDLEDFLEKWPAHALGRVFAKSNACVINNKLVSLTEVETKIPNIVPKPKFLDTLEKKICSGLKNIQSDERDLRFQSSNIQELNSLKREIIRLRELVSQLKEDKVGLETQVEQLTQSIKEEHDKFRYEADAKRLLISEINAMRMQFDESEGVSRQIQSKTNRQDDPVLLKIALEQARKAQSASEFEVVRLKAEYVNVMPKSRYDALFEENNKIKNDYDMKIKENEELNESLELLKNQLNEVMKQRDQSEITVQQLQRVSTPRPEWNEVGRKLPGGLTRWLEETASMSSQEKMHFLVNQVTARNSENIKFNLNAYIKEELNFVPSFLQTTGADVIISRSIQLRDCLLLTHEVWKARKNEKDSLKVKRRRSLASRRLSQMKIQSKLPTIVQNVSKAFDEFLCNFFKQIYGIEQIRIEWVYGFYEMLIKENNNYKLNELRMIIENKMDEECHWHLESWILFIKEQILIFIDSSNNSSVIMPTTENSEEKQKVILKQTLHEALLNIFSQQDLNNLNIIIESAEEYASLQIKDSSPKSLTNMDEGESKDNDNIQTNLQNMLDFNKLFDNVGCFV
ncbi:unnamed protein product [Schistosoma curassoni]|uniref:Translin-associated factor X-interacting protein 1 N-terminal domain-containing protein n=1 Tax=Schistosoma curassoni TaxID=6186 RepID=A0A183K4Q6_9TREM|nr:unnamed protein product [Schistosoma curassoni]